MKKTLLILLIAVIAAAGIMPMASSRASEENELAVNSDFSVLNAEGLPAGWLFEDYRNNPELSHASVETRDDGSNAFVVKNSEPDDAMLHQTIAVEPDSLYILSCDIKTENVESGAGANIALIGGLICRTDALLGDNEWTRVVLAGRTGNKQKTLSVSCRLGGYSAESEGTAWFSNFSVKKISEYSGQIHNFYADNSANNTNSESSGLDENTIIELIIAVVCFLIMIITALVIVALQKKEHKRDLASLGASTEGKKNTTRFKTPIELEPSFFTVSPTLEGRTDTKLHYKKKDYIYVIALTAVYAVVALVNLGSTKAPDNYWQGEVGDVVTISFDSPASISSVWQNSGIAQNASFTLTSDSGKVISYTQEYGRMFRWSKIGALPGSTQSVTLRVTGGKVWLNELAFFDSNGELLKASITSQNGAEILDEQGFVPEYPNFMNGMYFDELYHARTAYEHLNNMDVYETTHPPLGKIIISIGISIFGMNPFGWRIMGALFGIAMIPIMYAFGKRLFKRSELALLASFLFAFDFMHFSQTRIATIDVYGVFFILCMTYYMYKFIKMGLGDDLRTTLLPLALSGIFFGLGCASKWICIYAGAGLAVMFFAKMIMLAKQAHKLKNSKAENERSIAAAYPKRLILTLAWCVLFFIIIPGAIYSASYYPYWTAEWKPDAQTAKLEEMYLSGEAVYGEEQPEIQLSFSESLSVYFNGVWSNQKSMYAYHSGLNATHNYSSPWYTWPFTMRPCWFYAGSDNPNPEQMGTISTFGNPAVWLVCFVGTMTLAVMVFRRRVRINTDVFFVFVAMAAAFVPWVLVSRCCFIYHYFATVPFIILASVYVLKLYEDKKYYMPMEGGELTLAANPGILKVKWIWMGVALALFILFYPVISGIPVSRKYIKLLEWMPTWTFMGESLQLPEWLKAILLH